MQPHSTVKMYVCTNMKHNESLCSKCPPCARMQAQRRGRHCLIASSMNTWWKCSRSFDQARLQLVNVMNPAAIHTLLQLPLNLIVYLVLVGTVGWPQSWHDEVWCLLYMLTLYVDCVNTKNVTFRQVTAVSNAVLESKILCHWYIKINNFAIK